MILNKKAEICSRGLVVLSAAVLFFMGCGSASNSTSGNAAKFTMSNPVVTLTDAQLANIGATGLVGTDDAATATNILNWQKSKMTLTTPADHTDASYSMRWNYIMPGIFPVNEMLTERTYMDGATEKMYGVCWDFASIYIAVANKYGLTTRMTAWKTYMSGVSAGETGMGTGEYNALKVKLQSHGLNFTYDQINAAAHETWIHYRAEVKIGSTWTAFDGTNPTGDYAVDSNFSEVSWNDGANSNLTQ